MLKGATASAHHSRAFAKLKLGLVEDFMSKSRQLMKKLAETNQMVFKATGSGIKLILANYL
jgi:hypothetical protein